MQNAHAGRLVAQGMVAVHLRFENAQVTIENALDENGLAFGAPPPGYAEHAVG